MPRIPELPDLGATIRKNLPPSSSGDGTRQNSIPANRSGHLTRNLVRWFLPEAGMIDMYINPKNIKYTDKKIIKDMRTKGGYVQQYWGEEKTVLTIDGTTGSSGVEGINVLEDVYRSEQIAFDPYALLFASALDAEQNRNSLLGETPSSLINVLGVDGVGQDLASSALTALGSGTTNPTRPRPTLASLAFSVEMYWSGWTFRGYFTDFTVTENAEKLGLFDYSMTFIATQKRGYRLNFMPWHRSPTTGPSNSDPEFGASHSYAGFQEGDGFIANRPSQAQPQASDGVLNSSENYIGDIGIDKINR